MPLLECQGLGKIYESKKRNIVALDSTSFALFQGESLGILGQTGSGKSTLFRILAGLARPTSGEALIHDRPSIDPRARIGVGFVPENPSFPEGQSAFDTLIFSGRLAGLEGDLTGTVVHQLESLELAKWSDTPVSKFSREMTRRLALASALMSGPDLLIIDEPSDRYDKHSRRLFDQSVTTARQSGVTILHLAYSVRLMENTVDRVLFLERGSITGEIPVFDLLASRTLVEFNAEIGEKLIELPADFGHVASITRKRLVVEIDHEDAVNDIIDYLRISGIRIHSVGKREMSPDATVMTSHSVKTEVPT